MRPRVRHLLDVAGFEMYGTELNGEVLTNPRAIQQQYTITELLTGRDQRDQLARSGRGRSISTTAWRRSQRKQAA